MRVVALGLAIALSLACSSGPPAVISDAIAESSGDDTSGDDGFTEPIDTGPPPDPASFSGIYAQTIHRRCATIECHVRGVGGLALTDIDSSYAALVGVASQGCKPLLLVKAGEPESSALVWKLRSNFADKCDPRGEQMPLHLPPLPATESSAITTWITNGAKR